MFQPHFEETLDNDPGHIHEHILGHSRGLIRGHFLTTRNLRPTEDK